MSEFSPGELKTAIVPMLNPTVKPFDYSSELYMGTNLALMVSKSFHLEAGEEKDISFPVTMPSVSGTYPVYIGVFSGGESIGLYKAVEDVIIAAAPVLPFTYNNVHCNQKSYPFYSSWKTAEWWCTITNPNNAVVTQTLDLMYIYIKKDGSDYGTRIWWTFNLTLNPNQVYGFYYDGARYGERHPSAYNGPDIGIGAHITLWLKDVSGNESPKCTA